MASPLGWGASVSMRGARPWAGRCAGAEAGIGANDRACQPKRHYNLLLGEVVMMEWPS